jgi:hypothetical protein
MTPSTPAGQFFLGVPTWMRSPDQDVRSGVLMQAASVQEVVIFKTLPRFSLYYFFIWWVNLSTHLRSQTLQPSHQRSHILPYWVTASPAPGDLTHPPLQLQPQHTFKSVQPNTLFLIWPILPVNRSPTQLNPFHFSGLLWSLLGKHKSRTISRHRQEMNAQSIEHF